MNVDVDTNTDAKPTLTAAEAISEILDTVREIDSKLDSIIEAVNQAGEQLQPILEHGIGGLVGSLFRRGNGGDGGN